MDPRTHARSGEGARPECESSVRNCAARIELRALRRAAELSVRVARARGHPDALAPLGAAQVKQSKQNNNVRQYCSVAVLAILAVGGARMHTTAHLGVAHVVTLLAASAAPLPMALAMALGEPLACS